MKYYAHLIFSFLLLFSINTQASWWDELFSPEATEKTQNTNTAEHSVSAIDLNAAFKEALQLGSQNVVSQLAVTDGFNSDSAIHIPLPDELKTVKKLLATAGMGSLVDDLELKLNRAAEAATPQAKALFIESIQAMTFEDINAIYNGPEDSATQYFKSKMTLPLSEKMRPIVQQSLSQVGAVQAYDKMLGEYADLPFVPDVKADLTTHVVDKGISGIFFYLAKEEIAIRQDPMKQTSALLKQVFGKN